jgi:serine/threonine protein kinase/HAMP domain-containing protein
MTIELDNAAGPRMIGRFRVDACLGEGAMAQVYLAHDTQIERRVAIKVLKPMLREDAEVVRRFLAESRAAGMLSHPNIVTIHDVGEADGVPYIAMEYLDGEPLDVILDRGGRMTPEQVLHLGVQLASALALAHDHGVVHRDVKPSNIIICDKGKIAKLVDFGIARVDEADDERAEHAVRRTQIGQVMGTPRYMSPEQTMGLPLDPRTDLFSLGSILYEMAAGAPAFAGTTVGTLAIQIAQQPHAPISTHVKDCPKGLAFIIDRLLAKKPGERFADAQVLHSALSREHEALQTDTGPVRRGLPVRLKLPLGLSAVSACALALSVGVVLDRQEATLESTALASGASTVDFIARNVALRMADNAGLPATEQDWLPLESLVEAAARDKIVRKLRVFDEHGIVRASNDAKGIGKAAIGAPAAGTRTSTISGNGFTFIRPIRYANANFGEIEVELGRDAIDSAIATTRTLLLAMAAFVALMVFGASYFAARQLTRPLRRLRAALDDVARGNAAFRLSHRRRDEFGSVFDAFNTMAAAVEERGMTLPAHASAITQTRIEPVAPATARRAA